MHLEHLGELGDVLVSDFSHLGLFDELRQFCGGSFSLFPVLRPAQQTKEANLRVRRTSIRQESAPKAP